VRARYSRSPRGGEALDRGRAAHPFGAHARWGGRALLQRLFSARCGPRTPTSPRAPSTSVSGLRTSRGTISDPSARATPSA
jgi:hypothetical protein